MISKMAWNVFRKTGDINTYLEYTKSKNIEENLLEGNNGNNKDERNYFKGKQYGGF